MSFSKLNGEASTYASTTSKATAFSITPAIGDIAAVYLEGTTEIDPHLASTGATWTLIDSAQVDDHDDMFAVFRCTAAGSSSALTMSQDTDGFTGHSITVVRPSSLTYVGIANTSGAIDTTSGSASSLTVPLTTSSPAGLLAFGGVSANFTWTTDTGWTSLDTQRDADFSLTSQYRDSDDTQWIADPDTTFRIAALVLEFNAAGYSLTCDGGSVGINGNAANLFTGVAGLKAIRDFVLKLSP